MHREFSYKLGKLARQLCSGELQEKKGTKWDEAQLVINRDNGPNFEFKREDDVKWADIVSVGDRMTIIVRLSDVRDSRIESYFIVFKNKDRK